MLPKSCNIILFGPSGAGKSSLIKYYKYIYIYKYVTDCLE